MFQIQKRINLPKFTKAKTIQFHEFLHSYSIYFEHRMWSFKYFTLPIVSSILAFKYSLLPCIYSLPKMKTPG